jgi:UDP-2-acetamido-2-deoxy-ribo-hexuluronate aminotransferase
VNGRLDTLQCAILIPKLERFPWELEQRQKIATKFNNAFKELERKGVGIPVVASNCTSAWAQYTLTMPKRDAFAKFMQENGVPTSVHYPRTMPDQPAYSELGRTLNIDNSRKLAETVISLPMYPDMTPEIQDYIIEQVLKFFAKES